LREQRVAVVVVPEQGRILAESLPPGHPWSHHEQQATSLLHQGAEAAAEVVLRATDPDGVLLADGNAATPLVWHLCAIEARPGYVAGPPGVTDDLGSAVAAVDYDLVLLVAPDLPWEPDGIRDDPSGREAAFAHYRRLYPRAVVIDGRERERDARAVVSGRLRMDSRLP
jgi:nicotinamide riboside kinase